MFTSDQLTEGSIYTRKELREKFNILDRTLETGVFKPRMHESIWLFVTEEKTKDRPQLYDYLDGDTLAWSGQPEGKTDHLIIDHESKGRELLVFYRKHKSTFPAYGFRYEGRFRYAGHRGAHPTQFTLQRASKGPIEQSKDLDVIKEHVVRDLEAIKIEESGGGGPGVFREGRQTYVLTNTHERNPRLRTATIHTHGTRCQVCDFSFRETYGALGEQFIEVHHLYPVSKYTEEVSVNPMTDMAVVCSNCHRMIHRNAEQPLSLEELRLIVAEQKAQRNEQEIKRDIKKPLSSNQQTEA